LPSKHKTANRERKSATMKLTHINASSRTLLMIVHKLIDGSSVSGQMMLQCTSKQRSAVAILKINFEIATS